MRNSASTARSTLTRVVAAMAAGGVAALAAGVVGATAAAAAPAEGTIINARAAGAIKDKYIVVLKDNAAGTRSTVVRDLAVRYEATVQGSYNSAVRGFTAHLTETSAKRLAADPAVASVEQDRAVRLSGTQSGATWGLDRVDQRALPLAGTYVYPNTADSVTAYVLDTGVRLSHSEFSGRARSGYDFIDKDADASDCQGHGTHVAGTIAGATYGVAKKAKVVSVRVLGCDGSGSYSAIIAGVDWVTKNAVKPAVANMSLGGSASASLDTAVRNSIAAGVTYALAAGNDNKDACKVSPARTPEAITVGATDSKDARASYSNWGTCVDIFAPGSNITSSVKGGDSATGKMSGTSMATPHIAGVAALYLAANPALTPAQVRDAMVADATAGKVTGPGSGSPNKLVYTGAIGAPAPTTPTTPTTPTAPAPSTPAPTTPTTTPAGCTLTNTYDKPIGDKATVESKLTVAGCDGKGSTAAKLEVHVKHSDRGDLAIWLVAPDGTLYKVKSSTSRDDVRNLDVVYTVNLGSEVRNGLWKLRVQDVFAGDTGYIDSWTLTL